MAKSLSGGIIAIVMSLAVYFALVSTMSSSFIAHSVWFVPMIGAAVAAFIAPRHKFNVGAATFVPAALLMGAAAYVAGRFGAGDFVGA